MMGDHALMTCCHIYNCSYVIFSRSTCAFTSTDVPPLPPLTLPFVSIAGALLRKGAREFFDLKGSLAQSHQMVPFGMSVGL